MPLATTKIWPVRDSLRRVVDYAANPDKTEYSGLAQALHYAENGEKTILRETAQLVSGVHCRPATAWAEMRAVQEQFGKTEGVVAMHAYQSFKPGEVTPEQCHAIGVELARRVWGGRFQVLVATHMNTGCLHNHFVINAVSYVDGKKYEQRRSQYQDLRRISDQLCREYALSVIQNPGGKKPQPLYEGEGQTRYEAMRRAIRKALAQTSTERDFARVLRQQGYLWRREEGRKYATLRSLDGGRAVRVYRLGAEYDWPALERALAKNFARYGPHFYALNFDPKYSLQPRPGSVHPSKEQSVPAVPLLLLPTGHLPETVRTPGELAGDQRPVAGHRQDAGGVAPDQPAGLFHGGGGKGPSGGSGGANQRPLQRAGGLCPAAAVEGAAARSGPAADGTDPPNCRPAQRGRNRQTHHREGGKDRCLPGGIPPPAGAGQAPPQTPRPHANPLKPKRPRRANRRGQSGGCVPNRGTHPCTLL